MKKASKPKSSKPSKRLKGKYLTVPEPHYGAVYDGSHPLFSDVSSASHVTIGDYQSQLASSTYKPNSSPENDKALQSAYLDQKGKY